MRRVSMILAVVLILAGCGSGGSGPSPAGSVTSGAGGRHASADVAFVEALIPHHRQGIVLASAVARVPAARTLAEAIIATQQDEVVRMSGWLREWSVTVPPAPAASASALPPDPVRALIAHQDEAIRLAQQEQAGGTNPAALAFARQIVESRTEEIAQLRTYLG